MDGSKFVTQDIGRKENHRLCAELCLECLLCDFKFIFVVDLTGVRMSRRQRGISWGLTEARFTRSTMPSASVSISTSTLLFQSSSAASRYSAGVWSVVGSAAPCGSSLAVGSFEGRDTSDWGISDISESFKPSYARSHGVGSAQRQIVIELSARTFIPFPQ